jgi:hypothetical protein
LAFLGFAVRAFAGFIVLAAAGFVFVSRVAAIAVLCERTITPAKRNERRVIFARYVLMCVIL